MTFSVTQIGSWPRSERLLAALREKRMDRIAQAEFDQIADAEIVRCLQLQHEAGVDMVVDGELRRDNFYSFITDKVEGTKLMSLAEMLDTVEDKAAFEAMLQTLDAPAFAIRNPTCVGKLRRKEPLVVNDLRFVKRHSDKPVKVTLPGPYLLTRAMWVTAHSFAAYGDKPVMADDVVTILREELADLVSEGVECVQFDEPVLTEVVHSGDSKRRTFMCATLAVRRDTSSELAYAAELMNRVVAGFEDKLRTGIHVCRGNWSRREDVLITGDYQPLVECFKGMRLKHYALEYATPRAGELDVIGRALGDREIGLGCVNPRTDEAESVESIQERAQEALQYWKPEQISLNPDCGFGCFANRCVNEEAAAVGKLRAMAEAARRLRG
ncbi:MAG: cobalamin-independent methionine synthase II family protein [Verrucomicrobiaceae bacterium]|nr:cobalamin-independent methionine synthase II family protein [Verrucomicrobiaceae bacterium]